MVDLHAHVLPGIDDGPADEAASLEMLACARGLGTTVQAATPHLRADHPAVRPEQLAERCHRLEEAFGCSGLAIISGAEIDLLWAQEATTEELKLASYGGRGTDLLVETPYAPLTHAHDGLLERLLDDGFRVTLAHPELNPTFQSNPARLASLVASGCLVQVTASALLPDRRRSGPGKLAAAMVREGLAHVIASDAHSAGPWRPPSLSPGVKGAAQLVGSARAEWMVTGAPAAILAGGPLPSPPAIGKRGRVRRILTLP